MNALGRLSCLVVALCLAPVATAAEKPDLTGMWRGAYHYPEGAEGVAKFIGFTMLVLHQGDEVVGLITESNTFGAPSAPNLHATFKGRYNPTTRELQFTKTYDGTGTIDHVVPYRGRLGEDGNSVRGKWQVREDWGGDFTLDKIPETSGGPVAGLWIGTYEYPEGVALEPVKFSLYVVHKGARLAGFIKETKTFGEGEDPWLHATITGKLVPETGELSFIKTYDGTGKISHDVEYAGRVTDAGRTINGRWEAKRDWGSKFTLRKSAQP